MADTAIDEVRIGQNTVLINLEPLEVKLDIGLSCGHGPRGESIPDGGGEPEEGSVIFEVINLSKQVTVVDIDQATDVVHAGPGYIKGGENVEPDAYVETGRGLQLVFLRQGVQHSLQDAAYKRISEEQRGWWGMRTHDKSIEEGPQPRGVAGRPRVMVGLTSAGRQLADAWNAAVVIAGKVRQYRFENGLTHVKDGKVGDITGWQTLSEQADDPDAGHGGYNWNALR